AGSRESRRARRGREHSHRHPTIHRTDRTAAYPIASLLNRLVMRPQPRLSIASRRMGQASRNPSMADPTTLPTRDGHELPDFNPYGILIVLIMMITDWGCEVDLADIGGTIAWRCESLGRSQAQLGGESGVGQATISRLERRQVDVRVGTLREVARALDMDVRVVPREVLHLVDTLILGVMDPEAEADGR